MSQKNSAQNVIESYRKRQQMRPFVIGGLAVVLVIVGILILVVWLTGPNKPALSLFATRTPTPTSTFTPTPVTPTATATITPTITLTPTITTTPTASGPFQYTIKEGDTLWTIADNFKVDYEVLLGINGFAQDHIIQVGDVIYIPGPDTKLPTATPLPTGFRGDVEYVIKSGDSIGTIADEFLSTVDAIKARNKIEDINKINVGDTIIIPAGIATRVPTRAPTSTRAPMIGGTPAATGQATNSTAAAPSPSATPKP